MNQNAHDALTYLPRSRVLDFPKRCTVYDHSRPSDHLFLVLSGRAKIFCTADDGTQTLLRVVPPEGFFGETALIPANPALKESAVALDHTQLMGWTAEELSQCVEREPKLAIALFHYFGCVNRVYLDRTVAFTSCKTGMRVAIALNQLARAIGASTETGALRISGLTHQAIGEYVGTTREIITLEMNRLRRLGYLEYSRRFVDVHADALAEWMREQQVVPGGIAATVRAAG